VRNDPIALAIRIETLLVTSHGASIRPPREVTLALATFLEGLAAPEQAPPFSFTAHCAGCHAPPGLAGPPVALDQIGTDPRVGLSADRGTGGYRVPSLYGVGSRGALWHDASMPDLTTLFDPARVQPGHRFGLDLPDAERDALVAWLAAL
jgi:hypothetical protein